MFKKNKNLFKRSGDPFFDLPKIFFNEKPKRTLITPQIFKNKECENTLSKMISNNIFQEDEYFNLSFSKIKAVKTVFTFCDFRNCDFSGATFIKCDFSFVDFRNCNFSNVVIRECNFRHARFKNTILLGVDDFLCDFQGAMF